MSVKRGVGLVLGLLGLAVVMSAAGVGMLYLAVGAGPPVPGNATLVLKPGGELLELPSYDVLQFVQTSDAHTIRGLVETLRKGGYLGNGV